MRREESFGRYSVDCYLPERHLAFEADSDYYHRDKLGQPEYDGRRDAELLRRFGLPVVRMSEADLQGVT